MSTTGIIKAMEWMLGDDSHMGFGDMLKGMDAISSRDKGKKFQNQKVTTTLEDTDALQDWEFRVNPRADLDADREFTLAHREPFEC